MVWENLCFVQECDMIQSEIDHYVFYKYSSLKCIYLVVYVDMSLQVMIMMELRDSNI